MKTLIRIQAVHWEPGKLSEKMYRIMNRKGADENKNPRTLQLLKKMKCFELAKSYTYEIKKLSLKYKYCKINVVIGLNFLLLHQIHH